MNETSKSAYVINKPLFILLFDVANDLKCFKCCATQITTYFAISPPVKPISIQYWEPFVMY